MPEPRGWSPQLATLPQILEYYSGSGSEIDHTWPPPSTSVLYSAFPEKWGIVYEDEYGSAPTDSLYGTTLADFVAPFGQDAVDIMARIVPRFVGPIAAAVGTVGQWPVIFDATSTPLGGGSMRWLQVTHRGTLSGEQFQHGMAWGLPGNDPTTTEAEALALAELIADKWRLRLDSSTMVIFPQDVQYTEVGVVELNQSDPGGNVTESFSTQWYMYSSGQRPTGANGGASLPYEVSCAVTLQTDHRGASGRGRFYLPPFSINAMAPGGRYIVANVGAFASTIGGFFNDVKAATPHVPLVVSRTKRILNEVTSLNVGSVPDSQRRRRRSQDEARIDRWVSA